MNKNMIHGFVLEGNQSCNYYHRSGAWVQYSCPAAGYVWLASDIAAIMAAYHKSPHEWPIAPATVHPAIHDPSTGTTVLTGPAKPAKAIAEMSEAPRGHSTAKYTGQSFNLKVVAEGISKDIVAVSVSL
jgi:hypothetical protein